MAKSTTFIYGSRTPAVLYWTEPTSMTSAIAHTQVRMALNTPDAATLDVTNQAGESVAPASLIVDGATYRLTAKGHTKGNE